MRLRMLQIVFLKVAETNFMFFFFLCGRKDEKKKKKLTMPEAVTVLVCYLGSASSKCANTNSKISEETPELLKLTEKWRSSAPIVGRFRGKDMLKTYYYILSFSLDATFPRTSRHIFSWRDQDQDQEIWMRFSGLREKAVFPLWQPSHPVAFPLSLRALCAFGELLNWFCWHHHFSRFLQLASGWDLNGVSNGFL